MYNFGRSSYISRETKSCTNKIRQEYLKKLHKKINQPQNFCILYIHTTDQYFITVYLKTFKGPSHRVETRAYIYINKRGCH